MSVKAMSLVWDMECPSRIKGADFLPTHKFVLIAYADHADHNSRNIYPAVATIAKKTGFSERTIQRTTHDLEEMGLLIEDGTGPRGTNKWMLGGDTVSGVTPRQGDKKRKSLGDIPSGDIPSGDTMTPELKEQNRENISTPYIESSSVWAQIKDKLKEQLPRATFNTWVETTEAIEFDGRNLTVAAKNPYAREWLEQHITEKAQEAGGVFIKFVVFQEAEET